MYAFFSESDARNFFIYIIIKESVSICVDYLCRITWGFREKGVKPFWLTAQESTLKKRQKIMFMRLKRKETTP